MNTQELLQDVGIVAGIGGLFFPPLEIVAGGAALLSQFAPSDEWDGSDDGMTE